LPTGPPRAHFDTVTGVPSRVRRQPIGNRRRTGPPLPPPRRLALVVRDRLRKHLGVLVAVAAVALLAGLGVLGHRWLTRSPRFAIRAIEIRGNDRVAAAALRARVEHALGGNLFGAELAALAADLEREPNVAHAEVRRGLPDRLLVDIEEHVPAAVVELGGLYLADARGRVFARTQSDREDLAGLPIVTGLDRAEHARDPAATAARIVGALGLAIAWRAGGKRPPLGELHLDADRGTTVYLLEPAIAIHLGADAPAAIDRQLAAFDAAWAALDGAERGRLASIHLGRDTSPARVTVAFAEMN
jgi:cell division protein FtsQ